MSACSECGKEFQPIRKGHLTCGPRCNTGRINRRKSERYAAERAEIDKLRARVAELQYEFQMFAEFASGCDGWEQFPAKHLDHAFEVISRSEPQSLAKHDAAVLRTWAKNLRKIIVINAEDAADLTEQEADRLEQLRMIDAGARQVMWFDHYDDAIRAYKAMLAAAQED